MKRLIYLLVGVAYLLVSCETNVPEKERLIYVEPPQVGRKILIEDFTGQFCINCPRATDVIHQLQEQYGADTIIAVGIHSGPFGFKGNKKYPVGLATDLGDMYYKYWNIEHQPQGIVNRMGKSEYTDWAGIVMQEIQKKASMDLSIQNVYYASDDSVDITITSVGTNGTTLGNLQLWVVEDSIVAVQKLPDNSTQTDYLHNHVLRAAVNGDFGTNFTVKEGEIQKQTFHYKLNAEWKAKDISIVAFVYNGSGVQQVEKKKLIAQ